MPCYEDSKIYKLCADNSDFFYIGSTTSTLSKRLNGHRNDAKNTIRSAPVQKWIREIGKENVKIILIEKVSCVDKDELHRAEDGHIVKHKNDPACLNKFRAFMKNMSAVEQRANWSKEKRNAIKDFYKAYHAAHRDAINERRKEYRITHAEEIKAQMKEYRAVNREQIKERKKEYYATHAEEIAKKGKEYRTSHVEEIAKRGKEYRAVNKEKQKEYSKEYRTTHKRKIKECKICNVEVKDIYQHNKTSTHIKNFILF